VRERDYEGELSHTERLVRFDLRNHRREVISDMMSEPVAFVGERLVGRHLEGEGGLALIARDGTIQHLTPSTWYVFDFEVIDDHTVAVLAREDGERRVYTLDIDEPRPRYVCDADTLLAVSNHHLYVVDGGKGVSVDLQTGARGSFTPTKHSYSVGNEQLEVEDGEVRAHSMVDGTVRTLHVPRGEWRLWSMHGAVLARTPVRDDRSDGFLFTTHGVTPMASLLGGTAIFGVAELEGERWALIGNNTSRYGGDLADVLSEADVCLLPESGAVAMPTRNVPLRYAASAPSLLAAASRLAPGSELQVFDEYDLPVTVDLGLGEDAGSDLALMRDRARVVQRAVTSILRDPEIRTHVTFRDRRRAVYRWWRSELAGRTYVGMGDAMLQDRSEVGLELRGGASSYEDQALHCFGTLVNASAVKVAGLTIRCAGGDEDRSLSVPELAAGASFHFDRTFPVPSPVVAKIDVVRGRDQIPYVDAEQEAVARKVLELATGAYARTGLALSEHNVEDKTITVTLRAATEFATATPGLRDQRAHKAFEAYASLRDIYPSKDERDLHLKIEVDNRTLTYEYDGVTLTTNE
jgi:hypothetical protein